MAPAEADETTGLFFKELQYAEAQKQYDRLRVGDTVRKQIHKKKGFDKGRARWSQALYTVTGKEHNHYVLSDGSTAKHYELQRVAAVQKVVRPDREVERTAVKKDKKVVRDLRKEGVGRYQEADGSRLVGLHIRKQYGGDTIDGEVVQYKRSRGDPLRNYDWLVRHEDGDEETMNVAELEKYIVAKDRDVLLRMRSASRAARRPATRSPRCSRPPSGPPPRAPQWPPSRPRLAAQGR